MDYSFDDVTELVFESCPDNRPNSKQKYNYACLTNWLLIIKKECDYG